MVMKHPFLWMTVTVMKVPHLILRCKLKTPTNSLTNRYRVCCKPTTILTFQGTGRGVVTVQHTTAEDEQSIWELAYYRQFFNIDSSEVAWRCLRSMWPFKVDFINFVSTNPDFYGPFWVSNQPNNNTRNNNTNNNANKFFTRLITCHYEYGTRGMI